MRAARRAMYACVIAAAAAGVPACGDNRAPAADRVELLDVPATPPRQLDLLFQIDDSNASPEPEVAIGDELAGLFAVLATTDGGLPDLHVGVISSDLGASSTEHPELPPTLASNCRDVGRDGLLQTGQVGIALHGTAYLIDEAVSAGARTTNYDGTLTQVVTRMVKLGHQGCGFEQPLGAIRRALVPGHNAGFRRVGANLAVIILADEDDCSILDPGLLDPSDINNLGPLQSFRCTRAGVVCDQPLTDPGDKTGCHSSEDSPFVEPIAITKAALDDAAPSSAQVVLGAIIGDATPVAVELRTPPVNGAPIPALSHSCAYETPYGINVADPAVRIAELVDAFASRGVRRSVCTPPSSNQVRAIATAIKSSLGTVCLPRSLPTDCEAHDTHADGSRAGIPACNASRTTDCFELVDDPVACAETPLHQRFVVHRSMPPPALTRVTLTCAK